MNNIKFRSYTPSGMIEVKTVDFETGWATFNDVLGIQEFNIKEFPLLQFTGLHDKNGNEVYEGDILLRDLGYVKQMEYICYEKGMFKGHWFKEWRNPFKKWFPDDTTLDAYSFIKQFEVVGNIYENPELLQLDRKVQ
ncbi:YopX family protein [Clostridium brassicae]|uniref:YopX family protein n=1 Tax=Clostridium brassicae TaxID=2999072 RepID=A0ABT4D6P7_9CLOT|nr:YopX family protein [Clostridium brassicae]MCY6957848.1 YopX family protein [Clostridium brassicae]